MKISWLFWINGWTLLIFNYYFLTVNYNYEIPSNKQKFINLSHSHWFYSQIRKSIVLIFIYILNKWNIIIIIKIYEYYLAMSFAILY